MARSIRNPLRALTSLIGMLAAFGLPGCGGFAPGDPRELGADGAPHSKAGTTRFAVFGADDRVPVPSVDILPYSLIGRVEATFPNGEPRAATGILVGPATVLTVAHIVFNSQRGGDAVQVYFVRARHGTSQPFGSIAVAEWLIEPEYRTNPDDIDHDVALLTLSEGFDDVDEFIPPTPMSDDFFVDRTLHMAGYPGDLLSGVMYDSVGVVTQTSELMFRHLIDGTPGNSGAPIWHVDQGGVTLVGLYQGEHRSAQTGQPLYNHAMRITPARRVRIDELVARNAAMGLDVNGDQPPDREDARDVPMDPPPSGASMAGGGRSRGAACGVGMLAIPLGLFGCLVPVAQRRRRAQRPAGDVAP